MVVSSVPSRDCGKISYPHAGVVEAMQSTRLAGGDVQYQAIFMPSGKSLTLAKQDVVEGRERRAMCCCLVLIMRPIDQHLGRRR